MEVLKDYPKEFAKLFQPSFSFLLKINIMFLFDKGFVAKYWRFLYIIPCLVIHYSTLGYYVAKMVGRGHEFAHLMPPFLICSQAVLKFILLMTKTSLLTAMIKELGTLWRTSGLSEVQIKVRDALLKRVRVCNGVIYWAIIVCSAQYFMTPLVETLVRRFILKQDFKMLLPYDCSYPFEPTVNWLVYLFIYAIQCYSTFVFVSVYIGAELITITLCALLGVEFTLLGEDMLNVEPECKETSEEANEELVNETITEEMIAIKDIVQRHQKLCVLSTQLDEAFNQMTFIDLVFIGLTTCFCQFAAQAEFSRGPTYMMNYYLAMVNFLFYVLYLCHYGDFLKESSLRIGDMAYHSLWYKGDYLYQKHIIIIIMRSQKACCLTSLKYAPITLNTFTKVMSTTWSYFSVMNSAYGGEN